MSKLGRLYPWLALAVAVGTIGIGLATRDKGLIARIVIAVAGSVALTGFLVEYWSFWRRIRFGSPVWLLPSQFFADPGAVIAAHLARIRDCYSDVETSGELLKMLVAHDEQIDQRRLKKAPLADLLAPHRHTDRMKAQRAYRDARLRLWAAMEEFREIIARLPD